MRKYKNEQELARGWGTKTLCCNILFGDKTAELSLYKCYIKGSSYTRKNINLIMATKINFHIAIVIMYTELANQIHLLSSGCKFKVASIPSILDS